MLTTTARPYIDASVPVLREHGLALTRHFYGRMFAAHPELRHLFNQGNQASGVQQQSLAAAVLAYAAHIDNAAALAPVMSRIVHKHAAVGIRPAHYPIVGRHLLGAIADVLGAAATPGLLAAWDEAYWLLAGELIAAEARLYQTVGTTAGALQPLRIHRVVREGADTLSIWLQTPEGGSPGAFRPGQYTSVEVGLPDEQEAEGCLRQRRQYSLSDAPHQPWWRLTIKRETGLAAGVPGRVSNWLHDRVQVGMTLRCSPAFGDFHPELAGDGPLVLVSAGVGLTPMVSVLNTLAAQGTRRPVVFLHAARSGAHHALKADLAAAVQRLPTLRTRVCYEHPQAEDRLHTDFDQVGRLDLRTALARCLPDGLGEADFYLCGPQAFMRAQWQALQHLKVDTGRIHREVFGPDLLDSLAAMPAAPLASSMA
jgi:nitric oxide dioxygenase